MFQQAQISLIRDQLSTVWLLELVQFWFWSHLGVGLILVMVQILVLVLMVFIIFVLVMMCVYLRFHHVPGKFLPVLSLDLCFVCFIVLFMFWPETIFGFGFIFLHLLVLD